jgi:malate dehydrogenase (oxaloacetate-decarboxylating)
MRISFIARTKSQVTRLTVSNFLDTPYMGRTLLNIPRYNKGAGFTARERKEFGLNGLLPAAINTLDQQVVRAYEQYKSTPGDLAKNAFCNSMRLQNEVLFYRLILDHLEEMFSIIYTPTAGEAIENYSQLFRRPQGCFLDITAPDEVEERLSKFGESKDIDYIVVTDAEGILGIGDQGAGGIEISMAKLALMTVCAGIDPARVIPVVLDVGTDNEKLLKDPLYLGLRMNRVRGPRYDDLVERFIKGVQKKFPKAMVHFEDFGVKNAWRLLAKYREEIACFNDDIQGTGAVTMSALNAAFKFLDEDIKDSRTLIFGAGSAGAGIANQITNDLVTKGLSREDARKRVWLFDRPGLLVKSLGDQLSDFQQAYARDDSEVAGVDTTSLLDVIAHVKPHSLIGCSTKPKAFDEHVVKEMHKHIKHPVIFPLSNPTRLHEATPEEVLTWTNGEAIVATGSPFKPINGQIISENNNCYVFPGIGLGAVLSRAKRVSNSMIAAAVEALAEQSPILRDRTHGLLPAVSDIREVSARVATAVVLQALKDGDARIEQETSPDNEKRVEIPRDFDACLKWVRQQMWTPEYKDLRKA